MNDRSPNLRARLRALAGEAILDAAEAVLGEQGPQAGVDAIAARAGVAVGTIYNHFGDRDGLVRALLQDRGERLTRAMDAAIQATEDATFEAQLRAAIGAVIEVTEAQAAFRRMAFQTDLARQAPERIALAQAIRERLDRVLQRGVAEGILVEDPAGLRASLLLGLLHAAMIVNLRDPERLPAARIGEVVVTQLLDGARRRG